MAEYKCTVQNTGGKGLYIRSGPGLSYKVVGGKFDGATFTADATQTDSKNYVWYRIKGTKNWMCGSKPGKVYLKTSSTTSQSKPVASSTNNATATAPVANNQESINTRLIAQSYLNMTKAHQDLLESAVDGSVRLFGLPHQFTPYTDHRVSQKTNLGRVYTETFILDAPKVFIKPGTSNFLPGRTKTEKQGFLQAIKDLADGDHDALSLKNALQQLENDQKNVKYFDFEQRYTDYMAKVNMLCRLGAVFLKIHDVKVPWAHSDKVTFGNYDWRYYKFKSTYLNAKYNGNKEKSALNAFLPSNFFSSIANDDSFVEFYVDASASYSESASNSTTQSMLNTYTDSLSSMGKELAFISGVSGINMDDAVATGSAGFDNFIHEHASSGAIGTFLKRLAGTSDQLLTGGNFISPDIWSDSDYSKSYSFSITLATPYGNKKSWYLNVYVPLMHLLAFSLPSQLGANAFTAPPLVKVFSPGWFSCDLGIIDSISIEKASSGDAWSSEGLPLEIRVSLGVRDLYSKLALPADYSIKDFFNNDNLISFLMVNCGIDITNQGFLTKLEIFANLFSGSIKEKITSPFNEISIRAKELARSVFSFNI